MDPHSILSLEDPTKEELKEEELELIIRPIDFGATYELTEKQFDVRQRIGKREAKQYYELYLRKKPKLSHLCLTHPSYLFYTTSELFDVYRIRGFFKSKDGIIKTHAVSPLTLHDMYITNHIPVDDLIPLKKWNDNHITYIKQTKYKDLFLDPLGYANIV